MKSKKIISFIVATCCTITMIIFSGCGSSSEEVFSKENFRTDKDEIKRLNEAETEKSASIAMNDELALQASLAQKKSSIEVKENIKTETKIALKIIKNADISFQVENYKTSRLKLIEIINKNGGILSSENQTSNNYSIENNMVIRVKSDGFDDLVDKLMAESVYTEYRKVTSDDVTEQYIDAEARLKTKKATEARFQEILKKATTVQDILEVQNQINDLQEEIEAVEGKLRYLNDKVQYSTIQLHFYEKLDYKPAPQLSFWGRFVKGLYGGWGFLLKFVIGLAYIWPLLLIIGIVIMIVLRQVNKKTKK